jgi:hypothetical protein
VLDADEIEHRDDRLRPRAAPQLQRS